MRANAIVRPLCAAVVLASAAISLVGCAPQPTQPPAVAPSATLAPATAPQAIHAPSGRTYRVIPTSEEETYETTGAGAAEAPSCTKWGSAAADVFDGCARRAPKTTMLATSDAPAESFGDISALKATLQADNDMIHHSPLITHDADSERVTEELRNVTVDAYLFAVTKESDRDFHLIVGDEGCNQHKCFMNAEVSALPKTTSARAPFETVRESLVDMFGEEPSGSYWQIDPPAPVHLEGTLFYDLDHKPGQVGPSWAKPDTSWEIHPVSELALRDE